MRRSTCEIFAQELYALYKPFPHIAVKIETYLGSKQCHEYLKSLLIKDKPNRIGFDEKTYCRLLNLYLLHVKEFGDFNSPLQITSANLVNFKSKATVS